MQAQTPEVSAEKATTPPAVDDRTIYECTGCGTVTRDRAAQMALYKRAGALSCCPERNMMPVQQGEPLYVMHRPLIRNAINLLVVRRPVAPDVERVIADLEAMLEGQPTSAGAPSEAWLQVAEQAAPVEPAPAQDELLPCPFCGNALEVSKRRYNPHARCVTENCKGAQLPLLNIDQPGDVARWNTRPAQTDKKDRMAIKMLVAAGYVTEEKANDALCIAHGFSGGELSPAHTEQQPEQISIRPVLNNGTALSNIAYNLAQRPGVTLDKIVCDTLFSACRDWDAACATLRTEGGE